MKQEVKALAGALEGEARPRGEGGQTEISRGIDKSLWFVEAHLRAKPN